LQTGPDPIVSAQITTNPVLEILSFSKVFMMTNINTKDAISMRNQVAKAYGGGNRTRGEKNKSKRGGLVTRFSSRFSNDRSNS
jgi:hypothetical protein